jgi:hypothetical protein
MRRALSISLILILWLGPLAALFPAGSDPRLPLCCRRHGAHHCMGLGDQAASNSPASTPAWTAPSRCPAFPAPAQAALGSQFALIVSSMAAPVPRIQPNRTAQLLPHASALVGRVLTDRGPPAADIA